MEPLTPFRCDEGKSAKENTFRAAISAGIGSGGPVALYLFPVRAEQSESLLSLTASLGLSSVMADGGLWYGERNNAWGKFEP